MVDNFKQIEGLLVFPHKDSFYFVQILQRKKDHPGVRVGGSNNSSRLIKAYYIRSLEELNLHKEEMIKMADLFNARIMINLNPRSFEKTAFAMLVKVANQMHNRNFVDVYKAYNSVCGEYQSEMDKRWLVDINCVMEGEECDSFLTAQKLLEVQKIITRLHEEIHNRDYSILSVIPSRTGFHIITNPFNEAKFKELLHPDIEVHRNNPTNLYIP